MKYSVSLKFNHVFRRLYSKGTHAATPRLVLYCRRGIPGKNRLGITVSARLGHAVRRNKIRRRLKEIYRTNEERFSAGWDIVIVARSAAADADYHLLEADILHLAEKLGITR